MREDKKPDHIECCSVEFVGEGGGERNWWPFEMGWRQMGGRREGILGNAYYWELRGGGGGEREDDLQRLNLGHLT
jgi:hypothetical protein